MTQLIKRILVGGFLSTLVPAAVSVGAFSSGGSRLWPVAIEINLTSSFGEYRSGHLHAGIDVKTYGTEGVPCQAVGDGYVSRLRASPFGYGKAVYLKLSSGETAVYAHLVEFAPELEASLRDAQREADRYRVDMFYEPDRFPVSQGDIVGYTGRTGASAQHLHFEVRDEGENPLNPLSHGWKLADNSPPEFYAAIFVPLSKQSTVAGSCRSGVVTLKKIGDGRYLAADTMTVSGKVGMGTYIIDRVNPTSGRLAPYRVELTVDGVMLSSVAFESFTYSHTSQVDLAYDIERVRRDGENYLLLFRREGETLWNRTFVNSGVIDTELLPTMTGERKGVYTAVIRTIDRAGNVATALIPFFAKDKGLGKPSSELASREELGGSFFFEDVVSLQRGRLRAVWPENASETDYATGASEYVLDVNDLIEVLGEPNPHGRTLELVSQDDTKSYLLPVRRGEQKITPIDDLGIEIVVYENSFYSDQVVFVSDAAGDREGNEDVMRGRGLAFRLGPLSLAFRKPLQIRRVEQSVPSEREAFYRLDERKEEWVYQTTEVTADTLWTNVRSPGVYRVFIDERKPDISDVSIRQRKSYATGEITHEIVVPIEDVGSGVDDEETEIFIDGVKQVSRWDSFTDRMFVSLTGRPNDMIELRIVAVDRAGNESEMTTHLDAGRRD